MRFNQKGQEEIVGFALIAVVLTIVLLVFLLISLSDEKELKKDSKDVNMFLESSMRYTTSCAEEYEPNYASLQDLIGKCYKDEKCLGGEESCSDLNETLMNILESSWKIGEERSIKGYIFTSEYGSNSTSSGEKIVEINRGNCSSGISVGGSNFFSLYPGKISYSLRMCY